MLPSENARRNTIATYVLLTTLTPEGRQTLHKNPDRLAKECVDLQGIIGVDQTSPHMSGGARIVAEPFLLAV